MAKATYQGYPDLSEMAAEEVERCTRARLPLFLPWHPNEVVSLGTCFYSNRARDPWARTTSPFTAHSLATTPMIVSRDYGSQSEFKSLSTTRNAQTNDHLELGFGVGVGLPFLASVTVQGSYCQEVEENKDVCEIIVMRMVRTKTPRLNLCIATSINVTTRAVTIAHARQPRLSTEGIITIKSNRGLPAFHARYGDYSLAAYRLGGETSILASCSSSSKKELEKMGVTVSVEVLFVEGSVTHTKDFARMATRSGATIIGYDTLDHTRYNSAADNQQDAQAEVQRQTMAYCANAEYLDLRVAQKLHELGVQDGQEVDAEMCRRFVEAGLVVELMLLPMITLREVQHWMIEDNII